jgi:hypothetical protein
MRICCGCMVRLRAQQPKKHVHCEQLTVGVEPVDSLANLTWNGVAYECNSMYGPFCSS